MLILSLEYEDGRKERRQLALPARIGRSREAELHIAAWRVAKEHANLSCGAAGVFLEDSGSLQGTFLNGRRISHHGPLRIGDEIVIGPCRMQVDALPEPTYLPLAKREASGVAMAMKEVEPDTLALAYEGHTQSNASRPNTYEGVSTPEAAAAKLAYRQRLHNELLQALDLRRRDLAAMSDEALRVEAVGVLRRIMREHDDLPPEWSAQALVQEVVDEAVGLGPLETLLADNDITEIMVNRHDEIYVEVNGSLKRHSAQFSSEQAVLGVVDRIVSPIGRRIDDSSPMVDARLQDGSRVNAVIPPIALRGPCLTIRKFPQRRLNMDDLLRVGALDASMSDFLHACVMQRRNIIVSGGTGSGKTTLLNVLSHCIPLPERIVTIEDAAELRLNHPHLVSLEARPANIEGRGAVTIRDLVRNALRMRPDRIVVGECRGAEAFDMLTAMNTGHEGSLTTLHANSPRDALARLETMILMAGMDLPLAAVREHIAASVDLIVQQVRAVDGRRRINAIVEVTGMESGRIQTQDLFRLEAGPPLSFVGCQVMPEFLSRGGGLSSAHSGIDMAMLSRRTVVPDALQGGRLA
ncbi:Flp pilus assembly complex ATPase component TadA [Pusillimonas sp. CC-YST705]|uniref:Flp pilus assembly complex ATPase component TadA n=1 Tax=Mesopusillimonas faecipullorum TaxID=2755040 RepID=A0ABS8CAZ7_9BURK|nr:ATPase, T2SS/T4P/T4SS family [Mesopusillimonas faecipullorum]MCB5363210.1 Flp pilus assembly complex ATPase component TadA [Mesopusillimonas faecipullorum]